MNFTITLILLVIIIRITAFSILNETSQIKKAIKLCSNSKSSIEISGNISLSNIGSFKGLKIDYISIGDLTKNIESIDFSLLIEK